MRKNGIRFIAGAKLYEKLKNKRMNGKVPSETDFDWKKMDPGDTKADNCSINPSYVTRKKATALLIIGKHILDKFIASLNLQNLSLIQAFPTTFDSPTTRN